MAGRTQEPFRPIALDRAEPENDEAEGERSERETPTQSVPIEELLRFDEEHISALHRNNREINELTQRELEEALEADESARPSIDETKPYARGEVERLMALSRRRTLTSLPDEARPPAPAPASVSAPASESESESASESVPESASASASVQTRPPRAHRSRGALFAAIALIAAIGAALLAIVLHTSHRPSKAPAPSGANSTTSALSVGLAVPSPKPTTSEASSAFASSNAAPLPVAAKEDARAELDARAALERLRDGIGQCIRHGISTLPGSSPAVPERLSLVGRAGYATGPADWKTAVWSCARFSAVAPMRFQIQWQLIKPNVEGMAIAWLDDDADGTADRALAFRVTLKWLKNPILGEIEPIAGSHPVVAVQ